MFKPSQEQIEQCAHVCYEAQRALIMSRVEPQTPVPLPWVDTSDSERHAARETVAEYWGRTEVLPSDAKFADDLVFFIVATFKQFAPEDGRILL